MSDKGTRPQPTLNGYAAWVISKLAEAKGDTIAQVTKWIVERWIDDNGHLLAEEFQIRRAEYTRADAHSAPKKRGSPNAAMGD